MLNVISFSIGLAAKIGLSEAVIVSALNTKGGPTIEELPKVFPFWTSAYIDLLIGNLQKSGVLIGDKINRLHLNGLMELVDSTRLPLIAEEAEERDKLSNEILEVFKYWQRLTNRPNSILDKKRSRVIREQLVDNKRTVEQLKTAVLGCTQDPWSQGNNPRNTTYDELTYILRDADHVEKFHRIGVQAQKCGKVDRANLTGGSSGLQDILESVRREREEKEERSRRRDLFSADE
jgi:hypothetical protein